jgi:hypothetical protein
MESLPLVKTLEALLVPWLVRSFLFPFVAPAFPVSNKLSQFWGILANFDEFSRILPNRYNWGVFERVFDRFEALEGPYKPF